jgi:2-keto-4-pentenoate hydratase/2-oxohepta-3-ene-1,7-dioic acid hydratase in catechol pathway
MRIARFVHPASSKVASGVAWGTVEGPPGADRDSLTVAAIEGHPFETITFTGERWSLSDVTLLAPILPSKVVAVGKNYLDHVQEMGDDVAPEAPVLFIKPSTSVVGDGDYIRLPPDSEMVHHEAELAAIIGRPARDVSPEEALSHVFGYTVANDVSARDQQASDIQWARAKGHDSFCPLGPWIETVLDPSDLRLTAHVNGELRQDSRTSLMIHSLPKLISYMSSVMTLLPGDVIITGTPAGVGQIVAGDTVSITVEGIGTLTNPVRMK